MNFRSFKKIRTKNYAGFTIIELVVVFAISAIITTVVMSSYPEFSSRMQFQNIAVEIALTLREAQVYGMSVKEAGADFEAAYGVYFDRNTPNSFIFFSDDNNNKLYDDGMGAEPADTILKTYIIKNEYKINNLCGTRINPPSVCFPNFTTSFKRPNPDAMIASGIFSDYYQLDIEILNLRDNSIKTITITDTGQISVN